MKRLLLLGISFCCWLPAGDRTQPPVLLTQVDPDYRALTTGYLVDVADVQMTLDAKGVPFALNSSIGLPDNVVEALSLWRYRPYKKDGRDVPCSFTIKLPIRRAITPFLERHIRRAWTPADERVREAVAKGKQLTAGEAAQLEQDLPKAEALDHSRTSLLIYYAKALPDAAAARAARARLIAWLIENYADDEILGSPAAIINASGEPLADAEAQARAKQLWLQVLRSSASNPVIAEHAVNFLRTADPQKAIQILVGLRPWPPADDWLGNVYALGSLAVTALDPQDGSAIGVDQTAARSGFARSAQTALLTANDAKAVLSAMATVESAHASLSKAQLWTPEHQDFCRRLLDRTRQIYPATTASCDVLAPDPSQFAAPIIHASQKVTSATLRKKVAPSYPEAAKLQRLQGTLEFSALIGESGHIEQLGLLSGPLAFYPSTRRAVSQWEYAPTTINGRPVAVTTEITVHFDLR